MDRYVKVVLTVIAIALSIDVVERGIRPAQAAGGIMKVVICDPDNTSGCLHIYESQFQKQTGIKVFTGGF